MLCMIFSPGFNLDFLRTNQEIVMSFVEWDIKHLLSQP